MKSDSTGQFGGPHAVAPVVVGSVEPVGARLAGCGVRSA